VAAEGLTYAGAVAALERALRFGIHPSLDGIRSLTEIMGHPEEAYSCLQVTGTNGKTSVTRLVAAIVTAHGLRTGAYTSPHLVSYTERMEIDGLPITEERFAGSLSAALEAADILGMVHGTTLGINDGSCTAILTEFELLTAAALHAFRDERVDWACLEVGMGGRWDATSVVAPRVSVITGIGLDHTDRLGTTRSEIAADKAHIIKHGSVAIIVPGCAGVEDVLIERARMAGAPIVRVWQCATDVTWRPMGVPGTLDGITRLTVDGVFASYTNLEVRAPQYQAGNVAVALAAAEAALARPLDTDLLRGALAGMSFPGRFEYLSQNPPLIIDGAHNPEAAMVLAEAVRETFGNKRPIFVLGAMADKDIEGIVRALEPVAGGFVCTQSRSERALDAEALADIVRSLGAVVLGTDHVVRQAVVQARQMLSPGVVCTGSIYVAGEVREAFMTAP